MCPPPFSRAPKLPHYAHLSTADTRCVPDGDNNSFWSAGHRSRGTQRQFPQGKKKNKTRFKGFRTILTLDLIDVRVMKKPLPLSRAVWHVFLRHRKLVHNHRNDRVFFPPVSSIARPPRWYGSTRCGSSNKPITPQKKKKRKCSGFIALLTRWLKKKAEKLGRDHVDTIHGSRTNTEDLSKVYQQIDGTFKMRTTFHDLILL